MREALATADSDLARPEPRARKPRAKAAPARSSFFARGRGKTGGRRRFAFIAAGILAVAIVGILANALLLQRTRHPAPLLGRPAAAPKPATPRTVARPTDAESPKPPAPKPAAPPSPAAQPVSESPAPPKPRQAAPPAAPSTRPPDPIGQLLRTPEPRPGSGAELRPPATVERRPVPAVARRPAPPEARRPAVAARPAAKVARPAQPAAEASPARAPEPSRAVAVAQRALVKLGFVLQADGLPGPTTRKAVERYERDRGLPPRGVLSPEIIRRLAQESGIAIE